MTKRNTAIFLMIVMLFSCITVVASQDIQTELAELIAQGDFEISAVEGAPTGWSLRGGAVPVNGKVVEDGANGSTKAFCMTGDGSYYIEQSIAVIGGTSASLSVDVKSAKECSRMIKLEFYKVDAAGDSTHVGELNISIPATSRWSTYKREIDMPEGATQATVLVRLLGGGSVYYDNISIIGQKKAKSEVAKEWILRSEKSMEKIKPAMGENLLKHGDFETKEDSLSDWGVYGNEWGKFVSLTSDNPHGGNKALSISTSQGGSPWARYEIRDAIQGTMYQIRGWVKTEDISGNAVIKLETYSGDKLGEGGTGDVSGSICGNTFGNWLHFTQDFLVPENCNLIVFYVRLMGTGNVWYDDLEFVQTEEEQKVLFNTDNYFYYSDWDKGYATARVNPAFPDVKEGTVDFFVKDGETFLAEKKNVSFGENNAAEYEFPVGLLKEKKKEYTVGCIFYDKNGTEIGTYQKAVYRYDRPTRLDKEGNFLDENGKIFHPVFSYHHPIDNYESMIEAGINLVQFYKTGGRTIEEALDLLHENGIKAMYPLYPNMKPAGHEDNVENTRKVVEAIKDHPAIFGWMIMDEPYFTSIYPDDALLNSYKVIREIDEEHPIYVVEASRGCYERVQRYADILTIDPYPADTGEELSVIGKAMREAFEATRYRKPVYAIMQTFNYFDWEPNENELRNMIYQAFLEGAKGIGYYEYEGARPATALDQTEMWEPLVSIAENEYEDAFAAFSSGELPIFAEEETETYKYKSYVKDGSVYTVILNRKHEETEAKISLQSGDGSVTLSNVTAKMLYGKGNEPKVENGSMTVKLPDGAAVVYKCTPKETVDFSTLKSTTYLDLYAYPWAKGAIATLRDKEISDEKSSQSFEPDKNITRAEFAYFFMRTIGTEGQNSGLFDDVMKEWYYADELADGKARGILNGIGDNLYNPDAPITRQDVMTIIARGLKLSVEKVDLNVFSDHESIADYALEGVRAMVGSGLIQGNADGTLNPQGFTTRAEAAVIMERILKM